MHCITKPIHHCLVHCVVGYIFFDVSEIEQLADHGITLPPNMQGLTDEQIEELKLKDEWAEKCRPHDHIVCPDDVGRRNGEGNKHFAIQLFHRLT